MFLMSRIYVLHEYGSKSHYNGLQALCNKKGIELKFREFRFLHLIGSGIEHKDVKRIFKQTINFLFLIDLLLSKGKIIVLGMHPYDWRLPILRFILKKHKIFYHTSFTSWNPMDMEKYRKTSEKKIKRIKDFVMNDVIHVFAVTQKAKSSICGFTHISPEKVSVVYHSYNFNLKPGDLPPKDTYIYVGRMDKQKGIKEILKYFSEHPNISITLIGDGDELSYVKNMTSKNTNIHYKGYVKGLSNILPYYQNNAFFILNSKRTEEWEELFGQVLIEAMSCGCVPIAASHSGPCEIINPGVNGFLFLESDFKNQMDVISSLDEETYVKTRKASIKRGHEFESSCIAERWKPILMLS